MRAMNEGLAHPARLEVDGFLAPIREHAGFRQLIESLRAATSRSGTSHGRDARSAAPH